MAGDEVLCPGCGQPLFATFMVQATWPPGEVNDGPDTDSFLNAGCENPDCRLEFAGEWGDGRLRRALVQDFDTHEAPKDLTGDELDDLQKKYTDAVEEIVRQAYER